LTLEDSTFEERLRALTEYIVQLTQEGEHNLAGYVTKEQYEDMDGDCFQVEIIPEDSPHITVTWWEINGIIEKVGAYCTGYELPFVAFPPPTMMVETNGP